MHTGLRSQATLQENFKKLEKLVKVSPEFNRIKFKKSKTKNNKKKKKKQTHKTPEESVGRQCKRNIMRLYFYHLF